MPSFWAILLENQILFLWTLLEVSSTCTPPRSPFFLNDLQYCYRRPGAWNLRLWSKYGQFDRGVIPRCGLSSADRVHRKRLPEIFLKILYRLSRLNPPFLVRMPRFRLRSSFHRSLLVLLRHLQIFNVIAALNLIGPTCEIWAKLPTLRECRRECPGLAVGLGLRKGPRFLSAAGPKSGFCLQKRYKWCCRVRICIRP